MPWFVLVSESSRHPLSHFAAEPGAGWRVRRGAAAVGCGRRGRLERARCGAPDDHAKEISALVAFQENRDIRTIEFC